MYANNFIFIYLKKKGKITITLTPFNIVIT